MISSPHRSGSQERSENSAKRALVDVINTKVKITFGKRIYKSIKEARIKAALQSRFVTVRSEKSVEAARTEDLFPAPKVI
ncbi:hypothetical protein KCU62_g7811, partial [Aureobasidium sp. EXF-3399]